MNIYYDTIHIHENPNSLLERMTRGKLHFEEGKIINAEILGRKKFSNKGISLKGEIKLRSGKKIPFNFGEKRADFGNNNYMPFLKEMYCDKSFLLYNENSIIGKQIYSIMDNDDSFGIVTPRGIDEIVSLYTKDLKNFFKK